MRLDSLRDKVWRNLLDQNIQLKYVSALPDAFPMPKREYLYPTFDDETWNALVKAYLKSLEALKRQAVKEAENLRREEPPWMRKNSSSGLFENVYSEDEFGQ